MALSPVEGEKHLGLHDRLASRYEREIRDGRDLRPCCISFRRIFKGWIGCHRRRIEWLQLDKSEINRRKRFELSCTGAESHDHQMEE